MAWLSPAALRCLGQNSMKMTDWQLGSPKSGMGERFKARACDPSGHQFETGVAQGIDKFGISYPCAARCACLHETRAGSLNSETYLPGFS